jgi:hypothetical protein
LLSWIPGLRQLLVLLKAECDEAAWNDTMTRAYASVRRVGELTPRGWGHLHHSISDAVGNGAGGVMWIDVAPSRAGDALSFSPEWSTNAAEYLDYAQGRVQAWRNAYGTRKAAKVRCSSRTGWSEPTGTARTCNAARRHLSGRNVGGAPVGECNWAGRPGFGPAGITDLIGVPRISRPHRVNT